MLGARDRYVPGDASGLDIALSDDELVALHERYADRGFTRTPVPTPMQRLTNVESDLSSFPLPLLPSEGTTIHGQGHLRARE